MLEPTQPLYTPPKVLDHFSNNVKYTPFLRMYERRQFEKKQIEAKIAKLNVTLNQRQLPQVREQLIKEHDDIVRGEYRQCQREIESLTQQMGKISDEWRKYEDEEDKALQENKEAIEKLANKRFGDAEYIVRRDKELQIRRQYIRDVEEARSSGECILVEVMPVEQRDELLRSSLNMTITKIEYAKQKLKLSIEAGDQKGIFRAVTTGSLVGDAYVRLDVILEPVEYGENLHGRELLIHVDHLKLWNSQKEYFMSVFCLGREVKRVYTHELAWALRR